MLLFKLKEDNTNNHKLLNISVDLKPVNLNNLEEFFYK